MTSTKAHVVTKTLWIIGTGLQYVYFVIFIIRSFVYFGHNGPYNRIQKERERKEHIAY